MFDVRKVSVLLNDEAYSQARMDLSNPVEARRMHEEAQRIRAAQTFTVRANQAK